MKSVYLLALGLSVSLLACSEETKPALNQQQSDETPQCNSNQSNNQQVAAQQGQQQQQGQQNSSGSNNFGQPFNLQDSGYQSQQPQQQQQPVAGNEQQAPASQNSAYCTPSANATAQSVPAGIDETQLAALVAQQSKPECAQGNLMDNLGEGDCYAGYSLDASACSSELETAVTHFGASGKALEDNLKELETRFGEKNLRVHQCGSAAGKPVATVIALDTDNSLFVRTLEAN